MLEMQYNARHLTESSQSSVGESPSWLRHRILIPAYQGSNPCSPATNFLRSVDAQAPAEVKQKNAPAEPGLFYSVFFTCWIRSGVFKSMLTFLGLPWLTKT